MSWIIRYIVYFHTYLSRLQYSGSKRCQGKLNLTVTHWRKTTVAYNVMRILPHKNYWVLKCSHNSFIPSFIQIIGRTEDYAWNQRNDMNELKEGSPGVSEGMLKHPQFTPPNLANVIGVSKFHPKEINLPSCSQPKKT